VPAHALDPGERHQHKRIHHRRKPNPHGAHNRACTAEAVGARLTFTKLRQWLHPTSRAPRIPDVADMLVIHESMWQRAARMSWTQAFGVTVVAYLLITWVVAGVATSSPPADGPTAHIAGIDPLTAVPGGMSTSRRPEERASDVPDMHIDPQSFAVLERTLSDLDQQAGQSQPTYRQQAVDLPTSLAGATDAPASAPEAPASDTTVPEALSSATTVPEAPASDTSAPEALSSATTVAEAPATAPPPQVVANPNGLAADSTGQQPLGPLPGPAA
jgi:hypothetical protein